jgi:hypothetical protein
MRTTWLDDFFGFLAIPVGAILYVGIWWAGFKLIAWLVNLI